ncbi:MAG: ABC transporter substrate-binding protein [Lachnospirales bacterium]
MIKKCGFLIILIAIVLCGCSRNLDKKIISIAVTGSPDEYTKYFKDGIKKAYEDACEEYKDSGFEIKCEFYDDKNDYELADKITSQLVKDSSITAIISSSSAEISENQAYQTDKEDKILVCPHWMYDSTFNDEYEKVFSLNYTNRDIGYVMEYVSKNLPAKKWAVCYSNDKISREEIKNFCSLNSSENDVCVVDFVKANSLASDFKNVSERWRTLGVEGVVFIPYSRVEAFSMFYKIKNEFPNIYVISDSTLDNDDELQNNRAYFNNTYIVDSFYINISKSEVFTEGYIDTWEIHGYNTFKMIVDTAINYNTDNPKKIAKILRENGYKGELENFKFDSNGALDAENLSYVEILADDVILHTISAKN